MNRMHNPETITAPFGNYSQGVEVMQNSHVMFVAGQVGVNPDGTVADGFEAQAERALLNVGEVLNAAKMGYEDLARMLIFLTSRDDLPAFREIRTQIMGDARPASTLVIVSGLAHPDWRIEIEGAAARPFHFWGDGTVPHLPAHHGI